MSHRLLIPSLILTFLLTGPLACSKKAPEPETTSATPSAAEGQAEGAAAPETQKACSYSADPQSIKLEWTAYKFTKKTAVKGGFTTTTVSGKTTADSLANLVMGLAMKIDGASIESGDPGRNVTVKQFFFEKFNPPFQMSAKVVAAQGDDTAGSFTIELDMNGVQKAIPFAYTATPEGVLTAKSGFDMNDYQLQGPYDSIHKACETLHTGEDGVSKTWADVDLTVTGKFSKSCP